MRGQNINEDWVKKQVKNILNAVGSDLRFFMPSASQFGKAGVHDFVICFCGFYWTIETKAGRNKPTDQQIDFANDVKAAGGISLCVNEFTLDEVKHVIQYVYRHKTLPTGHDFEAYRK